MTSRSDHSIKLGTRASKMALIQAEKVRRILELAGASVRIVTVSTSGDVDLSVPIAGLGSPAPFCETIEAAILDGSIDIAVHSFKDLAVEMTQGLTVAAFLERDDPRECLVARGRKLSELPRGAIVGTSSARRAAQIRSLRSDLRTRSIRGPVDDRIRQVEQLSYDGAVLAVAGLARLGMMDRIDEIFSLDVMLPAPGQAALAVQCRADDTDRIALLKEMDHRPTRTAVEVEASLHRLVSEAARKSRDAEGELSCCATVVAGVIELAASLTDESGGKASAVVVRGSDHASVVERAWRTMRGALTED